MKEVIHRVKCGADMHRVVIGDAGMTFPDHASAWEEAKKLQLLTRIGGKAKVTSGCLALAAHQKLPADVPRPKTGRAVTDILEKRAAVRARLQAAAEIPDPAEKVRAKIREAVMLSLRRCSYKHRRNDVISRHTNITAEEMFTHWTKGNEVRKWVSSYAGETWDLTVQIGWLSQVYALGHATIDGKLIVAIDPTDSAHVMAVYECTNKDQYPGAYIREGRVKDRKLVWA